jgi:hypothetical protein
VNVGEICAAAWSALGRVGSSSSHCFGCLPCGFRRRRLALEQFHGRGLQRVSACGTSRRFCTGDGCEMGLLERCGVHFADQAVLYRDFPQIGLLERSGCISARSGM